MTAEELNTLHTICELERNQLFTPTTCRVLFKYFLYVEGSTAWCYDCPHFLSPLYKADRCFDRIPVHLKYTLMYVDPLTRRTYD